MSYPRRFRRPRNISSCGQGQAGARSTRTPPQDDQGSGVHGLPALRGRLIGLARVMGDGALYFFLADLIVDPAFRGEKLGDRLMRAVTDYFEKMRQARRVDHAGSPNGGESSTKIRLRAVPGRAVRRRHALSRSPAPAAMPRRA